MVAATIQPAALNVSTAARPIPVEEPVMITTCFDEDAGEFVMDSPFVFLAVCLQVF